jgi:hypothetical protein
MTFPTTARQFGANTLIDREHRSKVCGDDLRHQQAVYGMKRSNRREQAGGDAGKLSQLMFVRWLHRLSDLSQFHRTSLKYPQA